MEKFNVESMVSEKLSTVMKEDTAERFAEVISEDVLVSLETNNVFDESDVADDDIVEGISYAVDELISNLE